MHAFIMPLLPFVNRFFWFGSPAQERWALISIRNLAGDCNRMAELAASAQPIRDGSVLCETVDSRTHSGFVPGPIARFRTRSQQHAWAASRSAPAAAKGVWGSKARYNWPRTKS